MNSNNAKQLPLVIYHANCADGFTAAWAVHKAMPADFHAATYGAPMPDTTGRNVILVDFCYKPELMLEMQQKARSILVLDHHKSAADELPDEPRTSPEFLTVARMETWPGSMSWQRHMACVHQDECEGITFAIVYAYFDMHRSGAGIAWDFFHPNSERPALVKHVEDRDLWRFALPGTREIQAAVFSHPYTFEAWDMLASMDPAVLLNEGAAIERKHHKDVAELVAVCRRPMTIAGHTVNVASLPHTLTSDAAGLMADAEPFAACYWDTAEHRVFSLRSNDGGIDVAAIAQAFGGGGHRNAAGFRVSRDHELARA